MEEGKVNEQTTQFEVNKAKPMAIRIAKDIVDFANEHHPNPPQFAGLVASMAFQNVVTTLALLGHEPGSIEGVAFLTAFYQMALKDAVDRWQKPDLVEKFGPHRTGNTPPKRGA